MTGTHDDDLRQALRELDPSTPPDGDTLDRLWSSLDLTGEAAPRRRRWWDLALAACAGAALVAGVTVVAPMLNTSSSDSAVVTSEPGMAMADGPIADSAEAPRATDTQPTTLARDASAVVATEDVRAARDTFVATVAGLGGRVTSESSEVNQTVGTDGGAPSAGIYPPPASTPGVSLAVEVPSENYDAVVSAVYELGDVVAFTQSSIDVGTEIADTRARIAALRSSVATLRGLLDQATSVSQVVEVEGAIAERQSELDGLLAQQRYLNSQVEQARVSVRLIPPDAAQAYGAQPSPWQQILDTLATAWSWAGRILLLTSPVWVVSVIWWLVRRRRA